MANTLGMYIVLCVELEGVVSTIVSRYASTYNTGDHLGEIELSNLFADTHLRGYIGQTF